jgi:8-oxo-dGTP pyrophosphatase MutT (NUDIX family)
VHSPWHAGGMGPFPEPPAGRNPWRTTESREVYDNDWIRVREDRVVRPDGRPGIYGVVSYKHVALGAVPLYADGTTVLVGQHRYTLDDWTWEIPEGGGDHGLDPEEEMARELLEETGLVARTWTPLGALHTSNSVADEVAYLWLVEGLTEGDPDPEGTEELRRWRLPLHDAVAMALDGRITDAMSVAALCRAEALLLARRRR